MSSGSQGPMIVVLTLVLNVIKPVVITVNHITVLRSPMYPPSVSNFLSSSSLSPLPLLLSPCLPPPPFLLCLSTYFSIIPLLFSHPFFPPFSFLPASSPPSPSSPSPLSLFPLLFFLLFFPFEVCGCRRDKSFQRTVTFKESKGGQASEVFKRDGFTQD